MTLASDPQGQQRPSFPGSTCQVPGTLRGLALLLQARPGPRLRGSALLRAPVHSVLTQVWVDAFNTPASSAG